MGNILNLVFSKFDSNGTPIPNLDFLNEHFGGEYLIFPHIFLNLGYRNLNIRKCTLDDVTTFENFYYVIDHTCKYENIFYLNHWAIPNDVEELVRTKNLKIIFINEHESFVKVGNEVKRLDDLITKKQLKHDNFYIINNNSYLYDIKNELKTKINVFKINFLLQLVSAHLNVKPTIDDIILDKQFIFLCQNRRPKSHRLLLLTYLDCIGFLDSGLVDWSLTYGKYNDYELEMHVFDNEINTLRDELIKSYQKITSKPKLCYFEGEESWFENVDGYSQCDHISIKTFQESYINIITESHYDITDVHITEKTFKPFYYFQLPIFFASYHHIKKLKEEYDLFLFDDLINHSYDNEPDDSKRFLMVVDEIKRLSTIVDVVKNYYKNNIDKLIKNHEFIVNYKEKNTIGNFFNSLTKTKKLI
jgi:hypothetical protein